MNDKTIQALANSERTSEMGNKIWDVAQKVIGWALVAGLVFLVNDRNRAWNAINTNSHDLEIHKIDGLRRHDLLDRDLKEISKESERRHLLQARDISQTEKYMDNLSDRLGNCELQVQKMWISISEIKNSE